MKVEDMRNAIRNVYSGPAWQFRVSTMDERQVIAIYRDMLKRGIFDRHEKAQKMKEEGVQMTIWDIFREEETNKL